MRLPPVRRPLALLLVGVALAQLPFALLMPYHIDDRVYLAVARHVAVEPFLPLLQPAIWEGQLWSDMMSHSHPPLVCYYLFLLDRLGGPHSETVVHVGFIAFAVLFAAGMFRFLRLLGLSPVSGSLLAVFSPVVFVSSHTVMMDVPTLALGLWGVVLAWDGFERGRAGRLLAAGLCLAAAVWTSFSAMFYVIPAAGCGLLGRRPLRQVLLVALPPVLAMAGWLGLVQAMTGRFVVQDMLRFLSAFKARPSSDLTLRVLYNLLVVGGTIVTPVAALVWRLDRIRGRLYILAIFLAGGAAALLMPREGYYHQMAIAVLAVAGAVLVIEGLGGAVQSARQAAPERAVRWWSVGGWILILAFFAIVAFPHGAARYQLWLVPPLVAVVMTAVGGGERTGRSSPGTSWLRRPAVMAVVVAVQVALGSAAALADLELARGYRAAVRDIFRKYRSAEHRIWVAGEWGLRYYALAAGGRTVLRYDRRPAPGDILVKPVLTAPTWETPYETPEYGFPLETLAVRSRFPVRILNSRVRAGFYSDYWGLMPFWPAGQGVPLEVVRLYMVRKTVPADPAREAEVNHGMLRAGFSGELPP
jgi:hypothetical protein